MLQMYHNRACFCWHKTTIATTASSKSIIIIDTLSSIIIIIYHYHHHHLHIIITLHYTSNKYISTTMKVTALAATVVISSLPFINGYQTQRRTIQRLGNQENEQEEVLRYLSDNSMSMEAVEKFDPFLELAPNVTESAIEAEGVIAEGVIAGHSMPASAKSGKSV